MMVVNRARRRTAGKRPSRFVEEDESMSSNSDSDLRTESSSSDNDSLIDDLSEDDKIALDKRRRRRFRERVVRAARLAKEKQATQFESGTASVGRETVASNAKSQGRRKRGVVRALRYADDDEATDNEDQHIAPRRKKAK